MPEALTRAVTVGAAGVVAAVEAGEEPVFVVELSGVAGGRFRRNELFWVPGQPPVAEAADAAPGTTPDA